MFQLPEELVISKIESLHQELTQLLEAGDPIAIDISQVSQADTASIQLLCAIQKSLKSVDQSISWQGSSSAFHKSVSSLGLVEYLALE